MDPELPPRLRTQYSDISSDPEIELVRAEKVKHKDNSKYKSTRYVNSSSEAVGPKQANLP